MDMVMGNDKVKREDDGLANRQLVAEARVKEALDCIQEAQALLGRATQWLAACQGMVTPWREVGKRYDQVHGTWYEVECKGADLRAQGRLLLDHEPTPDQIEWAKGRR